MQYVPTCSLGICSQSGRCGMWEIAYWSRYRWRRLREKARNKKVKTTVSSGNNTWTSLNITYCDVEPPEGRHLLQIALIRGNSVLVKGSGDLYCLLSLFISSSFIVIWRFVFPASSSINYVSYECLIPYWGRGVHCFVPYGFSLVWYVVNVRKTFPFWNDTVFKWLWRAILIPTLAEPTNERRCFRSQIAELQNTS